jgi:hypothetical protein
VVPLEVPYFEFRPGRSEVFRNQTAVTILCCRFAAQQTADVAQEEVAIQPFQHLVLVKVTGELALVFRPSLVRLLQRCADLGCGCQEIQVSIIYSEKAIEEELEVITFGESGELRSIAGPDVDEHFDTVLLQEIKELLGGLLGESDRKDGMLPCHLEQPRLYRAQSAGLQPAVSPNMLNICPRFA